MDTLTYLFFEDPTTLWILLGLAELIALILWAQTHSRRAVTALILFPVVAVLLGLLDFAVETDREAVLRSIATMDRAAAAGDAEAVIERISPDYRTDRFNKDALAAAVRAGLSQVRVEPSVPTLRKESAPAGTTVFRVTETYRFQPAPGSRMDVSPEWENVTWEATFKKDKDGQWRLASAMAIRPVQMTAEEAASKVLSHMPGPS